MRPKYMHFEHARKSINSILSETDAIARTCIRDTYTRFYMQFYLLKTLLMFLIFEERLGRYSDYKLL